MANELLITRKENKILSIFVQERRILQIHVEKDTTSVDSDHASAIPETELPEQLMPKVGDIYVGKVRNIVKNINAAFVEFSKGQMGYLSLSDKILPLHTQGFPYQEGRVLIGDEIIVQVKREAAKTKPPTLTGAVDLTGRYAVLTMGKAGCSVSKKLSDQQQREQLRGVLEKYAGEGYGLIARTNSAEVPQEIMEQELVQLLRRYEAIVNQGMHKAPLTRLEAAPAGFLTDIRDGYNTEVERILTDDAGLYEQVRQYLQNQMPEELEKLTLWDPSWGKLDAVYNVSRTLEHALMPKVWLKSGAYLVIQPTEALISIDVNTGKAISQKKDVQKTFFKVNVEAAREIAYQLRLRNLSGMILIDFIDMAAEQDKKALLEVLRQEVRRDPVQTSVIDMTKLGLVELTRKKVKKSLFEQYKIDEEQNPA